MFDPDRQFENVVNLARQEKPPSVDVAGSVIAILAGGGARSVTGAEKFWMWLAAASSAVAVPAAIFALISYSSWNDPLTQIFNEISWVMQ